MSMASQSRILYAVYFSIRFSVARGIPIFARFLKATAICRVCFIFSCVSSTLILTVISKGRVVVCL